MIHRVTTKTQKGFINNARKELKEIKDIFNVNNTEFFLLFGTCLGALREQNIIPWDTDVDIGVLDHTNKSDIHKSVIEHGFKFKRFGNPWHVSKRIPHADIFWFVKKAGKIICSETEDHISFSAPVSFFNHFREVKIGNEVYLAPSPTEEYLKVVYGSNWRRVDRFRNGVYKT